MATSTDFKSLVPDIKTIDDIFDYVRNPLLYQHMFKRKTSPCEISTWDDDLHNFKIDKNQIDRLYAVNRNINEDEVEYYLLCRMKYKDKNVFVKLIAICSWRICGGEIYVTTDANIFYNVVVSVKKEKILESLLEDNYNITIYSDLSNPPKLMYMCHKVIMDNQHRLAYYPEVLPKSLTKSLNEFITIKEAMNAYNPEVFKDNDEYFSFYI